MILLTLVIFSLIVSRAYTHNLRLSVKNAPRTDNISAQQLLPSAGHFPKVSVIVPAYNEAENIRDCTIAILESTALSADNLEVLIVDDRSTDDTLAIAQTLQQQLNDPRLKILQVRGDRPTNIGRAKTGPAPKLCPKQPEIFYYLSMPTCGSNRRRSKRRLQQQKPRK